MDFYLDGNNLLDSTTVFTDENMSIYGNEGYYSDGDVVRYFENQVFGPVVTCIVVNPFECSARNTFYGLENTTGVYNFTIKTGYSENPFVGEFTCEDGLNAISFSYGKVYDPILFNAAGINYLPDIVSSSRGRIHPYGNYVYSNEAIIGQEDNDLHYSLLPSYTNIDNYETTLDVYHMSVGDDWVELGNQDFSFSRQQYAPNFYHHPKSSYAPPNYVHDNKGVRETVYTFYVPRTDQSAYFTAEDLDLRSYYSFRICRLNGTKPWKFKFECPKPLGKVKVLHGGAPNGQIWEQYRSVEISRFGYNGTNGSGELYKHPRISKFDFLVDGTSPLIGKNRIAGEYSPIDYKIRIKPHLFIQHGSSKGPGPVPDPFTGETDLNLNIINSYSETRNVVNYVGQYGAQEHNVNQSRATSSWYRDITDAAAINDRRYITKCYKLPSRQSTKFSVFELNVTSGAVGVRATYRDGTTTNVANVYTRDGDYLEDDVCLNNWIDSKVGAINQEGHLDEFVFFGDTSDGQVSEMINSGDSYSYDFLKWNHNGAFDNSSLLDKYVGLEAGISPSTHWHFKENASDTTYYIIVPVTVDAQVDFEFISPVALDSQPVTDFSLSVVDYGGGQGVSLLPQFFVRTSSTSLDKPSAEKVFFSRGNAELEINMNTNSLLLFRISPNLLPHWDNDNLPGNSYYAHNLIRIGDTVFDIQSGATQYGYVEEGWYYKSNNDYDGYPNTVYSYDTGSDWVFKVGELGIVEEKVPFLYPMIDYNYGTPFGLDSNMPRHGVFKFNAICNKATSLVVIKFKNNNTYPIGLKFTLVKNPNIGLGGSNPNVKTVISDFTNTLSGYKANHANYSDAHFWIGDTANSETSNINSNLSYSYNNLEEWTVYRENSSSSEFVGDTHSNNNHHYIKSKGTHSGIITEYQTHFESSSQDVWYTAAVIPKNTTELSYIEIECVALVETPDEEIGANNIDLKIEHKYSLNSFSISDTDNPHSTKASACADSDTDTAYVVGDGSIYEFIYKDGRGNDRLTAGWYKAGSNAIQVDANGVIINQEACN